eukprot:14763317-Alexandrium_andersonii.AAC.1
MLVSLPALKCLAVCMNDGTPGVAELRAHAARAIHAGTPGTGLRATLATKQAGGIQCCVRAFWAD